MWVLVTNIIAIVFGKTRKVWALRSLSNRVRLLSHRAMTEQLCLRTQLYTICIAQLTGGLRLNGR